MLLEYTINEYAIHSKYIAPWFYTGATTIGMSSKLFTKEWLTTGDYPAITDRIKSVLDIIKSVRPHSI